MCESLPGDDQFVSKLLSHIFGGHQHITSAVMNNGVNVNSTQLNSPAQGHGHVTNRIAMDYQVHRSQRNDHSKIRVNIVTNLMG